MAAMIAMITTTIINSSKVKPRARGMACCLCLPSLVIVQLPPGAPTPDRIVDVEVAAALQFQAREQQLAAADHRSHRHRATGRRVGDAATDRTHARRPTSRRGIWPGQTTAGAAGRGIEH